jgi:exopolysaccharide biosynthesis operon protein EpsL
LSLTAGYSVQTNSNLFLLSGDQLSALGQSTPSATIELPSASLKLDKSYSLQRFQLTASVLDYRYQSFDYLSFTAFNYAAAWLWSLSPDVRGTLSTTRDQTPTNFATSQGDNARNVRTDKATRFDGEVDIGGPWRLLGGLDYVTSSEEQPVVLEGNLLSQTGAVGIRYVLPSGASASYRYRLGNGDTFGSVSALITAPTSFSSTSNEIQLSWPVSGKTTLTARAGYNEQNYDNLQLRDFKGPVGDLAMQWAATPKLNFTTTVRRELVPYQTTTSSYITTDRLIFSPLWQLSARTGVKLSLEAASRNYAGNALPGMALGVERQDTYRAASIGVEWHPVDAAKISISLQRLRNSSNYSAYDYDNNGATFAAQFSF